MKFQLNSFLAAGAVVVGVLLGATATQAATVEKDGDVATAIRDLTVGSNTYDVTFPVTSSAITYGDPPTFDANTSAQAKTATEAVVAVLNAEGGVLGVGVSAADGRPIFRVPWAIEDIHIPIVDITVRFLFIWEGVTGDTSSPGVWGVLTDFDQFPFGDDGAFAKFTLVGTGGPGNSPPEADAGGPYEGAVDVAVQFDGSGSSDSDGSIKSRKWDFGDDSTGKGKTVEHVYTAAGTYNVIHTVTDDAGAKGSDSTTVRIGSAGKPPVADAGGPYEGSVDEKVEFDGSGSNDPDGNIRSYEWDFGDGGSESGETPDYKYEEPGTYTVTLTVEDNNGAKTSDETTAVIDN